MATLTFVLHYGKTDHGELSEIFPQLDRDACATQSAQGVAYNTDRLRRERSRREMIHQIAQSTRDASDEVMAH